MGKIGRTLFGGPSQGKTESGNHAWDAVSESMTPALGYTTQGGSAIGNLLGLNGGAAQTEGLSNFANSGGMKWMQDEANRGINANQSAQGLLKSGSTLKAVQDRQTNIASTYLNSYMDKLFNYSNLGLGAANSMTAAGAWSKGKQEGEKKGAVQSIAKAIASTQTGGA